MYLGWNLNNGDGFIPTYIYKFLGINFIVDTWSGVSLSSKTGFSWCGFVLAGFVERGFFS